MLSFCRTIPLLDRGGFTYYPDHAFTQHLKMHLLCHWTVMTAMETLADSLSSSSHHPPSKWVDGRRGWTGGRGEERVVWTGGVYRDREGV